MIGLAPPVTFRLASSSPGTRCLREVNLAEIKENPNTMSASSRLSAYLGRSAQVLRTNALKSEYVRLEFTTRTPNI